jgi:hypothetical protein
VAHEARRTLDVKRQLLLFALLALVAADAAARSGVVAAAFGRLGLVTTGLGGRAVIFLLGFGLLATSAAALGRLRAAVRLLRERRAAAPPAPPGSATARPPAAAPGLPG